MKLRILTLPLTLTLGLAATAFAADQPVTQTPVTAQPVSNQASVVPNATSPAAVKIAKGKAAKKEGRGRKLGKGKKVDTLSLQPAAK